MAVAGEIAPAPDLEDWVVRAREVADVFRACPGVRLNPDPPQVNFFQVYFEGHSKALVERHHQLAEATGTFLFRNVADAAIPGFAMTEFHMFENAMRFDLSKLRPFVERLLEG